MINKLKKWLKKLKKWATVIRAKALVFYRDCQTRGFLYKQSFSCTDRGRRRAMRWIAIHDEIGMVLSVSDKYAKYGNEV